MNNSTPGYFRYWGKADQNYTGEPKWHALVYHCLDVSAVASMWLELDDALRTRIAYSIGLDKDDPKFFSIISFFIALHDIGKFDIRFQSKVPELRNHIWKSLNTDDLALSHENITAFDHGKSGYALFVKFYPQLLGLAEQDHELLDRWKPWIAAVTGHHGILPVGVNWQQPNVEKDVIEQEKIARSEWLKGLSGLFLKDYKTFSEIPELPPLSIAFLAGFCSVADWIASNERFVRWVSDDQCLEEYFKSAKEHCRETEILLKTGVLGKSSKNYGGIKSLISGNKPRQVQTIIDELSSETGLTIIEGTTGSGKTEAALALAWRLIAEGKGDSIIFALPTQATADAMLDRIQNITPILFKNGDANLVLAHGKRNFNDVFANLKAAGRRNAVRNGNQGSVQCAEWISTRRKRVFLGQIGVCTIDQVLLSVLPIRHNFVRSFGLMKSVLIIDEIHAYDRYMYGLLEEVLKRQKTVGGSAILLSATLPAVQKTSLFNAWNNDESDYLVSPDAPYPLLSKISANGDPLLLTVDKEEMPPQRIVKVEMVVLKDMEPTEKFISKIYDSAKQGATVAVICNLVQSAQRLTRRLRILATNNPIPVDIFHGRFRFKDRQLKEDVVKKMYGKTRQSIGRILIATQVIEQSLDLDFDWMITQLCPVDLLFQRLGRLHRHDRKRPQGFEEPTCTVISNDNDKFGAHEYIYGDTRILWRTRELLKKCDNLIHFPDAYREWIEKVYGREEWEDGNEPNEVIGGSVAFRQAQELLWFKAKSIATADINPFADTDQNTLSLTRGKEMGLIVVPIQAGKTKNILLDGEYLEEVNEFQKDELLNMNSIPAPANWKWLPPFQDGYIYLPMEQVADGWIWLNGKYSLKYTTDFGLERLEATNESTFRQMDTS